MRLIHARRDIFMHVLLKRFVNDISRPKVIGEIEYA